MLFLLLAACSRPPVLEGTVHDIWGKPVGGATVVVEGVLERFPVDESGLFRIQIDTPIPKVMVGKPGYIKHVEAVAPPAEKGDDYAPLTFSLYPEPEEPGFYAIGASDYVPVQPQRIVMVGTELRHYAGLRDIPVTGLGAGKVKFVFTSRLRPSELARMNLHLSRLDFVGKTPVKGILGPMEATVNLWTAAEEIAFDLEQLESRDDYLITVREPLAPGEYAFHAQDVLREQDERVYLMMPKEMQVAFPFEVQ